MHVEFIHQILERLETKQIRRRLFDVSERSSSDVRSVYEWFEEN